MLKRSLQVFWEAAKSFVSSIIHAHASPFASAPLLFSLLFNNYHRSTHSLLHTHAYPTHALRTCNVYFVHLVVYTHHVQNNLRAFPSSHVNKGRVLLELYLVTIQDKNKIKIIKIKKIR